uniref:Uncharacterized protein n=1 Tax=uncultured marine group II/III euryarchaeote KM3_31_G09 TaxID=1456432 RepID=A0A075H2B6_9EURY|nr:hypothetical protein [uncultured marine group II/III euryarchaeote KM3_31_G09]
MENEKFGPLKMAGVDGQITAVLTNENLLLERSDRKGMRIDLDTITRIRHHHVAFTPPLVTLFGVLAIFSSFRLFTGVMQYYSFILGTIALLAWLLGRRPALCIDTKQGDRHLLHGRDHLLHRLYTILDRMSDGYTLDDAVIGLEELQQPELGLIGDIEDIRHEAGSVAIAEAELQLVGVDESLGQALAKLHRNKSPNTTPSEMVSTSSNTPQPTDSSAYEKVWGRGEPDWYSEKDSNQTSMMERSTKALAEQREQRKVTASSYDTPFQLPDYSNQPSSSSVTTVPVDDITQSPPLNRAHAAALEASEASFDSGGLFDMFDELDSASEYSANTPLQNEIPSPPTQLPAITQPSWKRSPDSKVSSYTMLSEAAGPNLPEPTRVALRSDLPTNPGLVASAAVKTTQEQPPLPGQLQRSFDRLNTPHPLESYPALSRMQKQYARDSRIRVSRSYSRSRGALKAIREWVKPGLKRMEKGGKNITRKIIGAGDGYREVYGDDDGNQNDDYKDTQLNSTQILRLRADQDSQSDVQARLRLLTTNGGGAIADDLANRTLRGISSSSKSESFTLSGMESKKLNAPQNFNGMVASNEPAPRFAGMQRLG